MILKTKKSKSSTKKSNQVSKQSINDNLPVIKKPKLARKYKNMEPCSYRGELVPVSKLTYGMIASCDTSSMRTPEGTIELSKSWVEALLILIDTLVQNSETTKKFTETLQTFNITNQFFSIDTTFGKYALDGKEYHVYKIFNSNFYLEYLDEPYIMFDALVGLLQANDLQTVDVEFRITSKEFNKLTVEDKTEIELNYRNIPIEVICLDNLNNTLHKYTKSKRHMHLLSVDLYGVSTTVHRIDASFLTYCTWLFNKFGDTDELKSISSIKVNNTFITTKELNNKGDLISQPIKGTDYIIYTDLKESDLVTYMVESSQLLKLDTQRIKFKFRESVDTDNRDEKTLEHMKLNDELESRHLK
jgi:hypothetical protein